MNPENNIHPDANNQQIVNQVNMVETYFYYFISFYNLTLFIEIFHFCFNICGNSDHPQYIFYIASITPHNRKFIHPSINSEREVVFLSVSSL